MTDHMIAFDQKLYIYLYIYIKNLSLFAKICDGLFISRSCWNSAYENFRDGFYFNFEFEDYVKTIYTVDNKFIETVVPNL